MIDGLLPKWITWMDQKKVYDSFDPDPTDTVDGHNILMRHAISFNGLGGYTDAIHDVVIANSTIENEHDGVELTAASFHDLEIINNHFENIADDVVQLGTQTYDVNIGHNAMLDVATSVSKDGSGDVDDLTKLRTKYIHHNKIILEKKLYCRADEDTEVTGAYSSTSCDGDGKLPREAFAKHNSGDVGSWGDPRTFYNNTVYLVGEDSGIGFSGQYECDDSDCLTRTWYLPYGKPALVFNNIFHQTDSTWNTIRFSPNYLLQYDGGPNIILDGNMYYAEDGGSLFYMSGPECDFSSFQDDSCDTESVNHEYTDYEDYQKIWEFHEYVGIESASGLLEDYEIDCSDTNRENPDAVDPAVDLTDIENVYWVEDSGGSTDWQLDLSGVELPGAGGGVFRGAVKRCHY